MTALDEPDVDRAPRPGCPKRMVYGPCGGVRDDLTCEVAPHPCPFTADAAPLPWPTALGPPPAPTPASGLLARATSGPVVVTDLPSRPFDRALLVETTEVLAESCDAVLVGEHQHRPDLPPTLMAAVVAGAGGRPIVTLSCRDRNRVVLEQELGGLATSDVEAVLCVTGDARAPGIRPEVTQVFDLDGTRLAGLAAAAGLTPVVPESPDAPPRAIRPARLREKQAAGARIAVLNHVGSVEGVRAFAAAARDAGVTLPLVAAVAVYTDARSADVLARFPGLHLDPDAVAAVLGADDPLTAGVEAAVDEAVALLEVDGVAGVNISGLGSAEGELAAARVKATVGRELRDRLR
ncbi:methylenetetrahydrofolate reductase C-terminal domain-containing protein [Iamia majanohamensis]|uniref:Methylenetetrahydrofolate reductase C-terminal domain-containing protein n=2 Tax=Iamia majanohamensis TaxID=467976 RepID=A0AAF0BWU9_9ACTN|nr:methylenetetrahydrofolate reductase C-terminal domain-containing protein [Iamia majanohamensis]WCO68215.1 methylenetetrahydrofolate reductase C-terminal domain-containing protein [Iamia majanohamensis]